MRLRLEQHAREAAGSRGLSLADYAELLRRDHGARQALVDRLLVPTTSFFRHPEQFDALRRLVPGWPGPVTIWSAGCSTGQEAYSLAMLMRESARQDWSVVASDVSSTALQRAEAAVYQPRELAGLSEQRRRLHLEPAGPGWRVVGEVRERVRFVHHNLATEDVPAAASGAVAAFCRNVLIYMRPEAQRTILERFVERLRSLQILFLGATESLWGVTDRLVPVSLDGVYAYRPAGGRRVEAAPPRAPRRRPAAAPSAPAPPSLGTRAHMAEGEAALAAGRPDDAVAAFRKACYIEPDDPLAHFNLALALEAGGHGGARRAYAAARAALQRRGVAVVETELEGFRADELLELIERRLRDLR
jgi:chemotaxis methyl-accepting protein methylase